MTGRLLPLLLGATVTVSVCVSIAAGNLAADPLAESLGALSFLNAGEVKATDTFERLTQCNGFAESYTDWTTGGIRDYLYETTTGNATVPPVGMRSAVPLGGLGTGTFEVRADGSFADWQVENQGPALATNSMQNSKLPLIEGALLGLKVDGFATTLRTHPPTGLPAAEALSYSGAYPFARLGLNDSRLQSTVSAQVYAYSAVKLHDANASALPAVAFTLVVTNRGPAAVNASFLLTLPLASTASTSRRTSRIQNYHSVPIVNDTSVLKTLGNISPDACLKACGATRNCSYWDIDLQGTPGIPAVPAVPPSVNPDHDCQDLNMPNTPSDLPFATIDQCYAKCNATKGWCDASTCTHAHSHNADVYIQLQSAGFTNTRTDIQHMKLCQWRFCVGYDPLRDPRAVQGDSRAVLLHPEDKMHENRAEKRRHYRVLRVG
jgi:hypothetical protein